MKLLEGRKWRACFGAVFMAAALVLAGCGAPSPSPSDGGQAVAAAGSELTMKMLDIGQGDAALIRIADQVILIDTGDVEERDRIVALLKKEKVTAIDQLIITHPHADHMGGAYAVFKNFTVRQVYDNGQPGNTATYRTYLKQIKAKKIPYRQLLAGQTLDFGGGARFQVFNPTAAEVKQGGELNSNSVVGKLTFGNFSMLFTGDCEADREKELLKKYGKELKSDVLKSPHHGSKTSSNRNFLKAVAPEAALISVGQGNDYKHPHAVTLNKYKDMKIRVYRTDRDGSITVRSDGAGYEIEKEK